MQSLVAGIHPVRRISFGKVQQLFEAIADGQQTKQAMDENGDRVTEPAAWVSVAAKHPTWSATMLRGLAMIAGCLVPNVCAAQWEKTFEQIPAVESLPDSTDRLQRRIDENGGNLTLTEPVYRITRTLEVDLARHGPVSIRGSAGTTLVMQGKGPALRLRGTHEGTASPKTFRPSTWNQRMPIVRGIEILGAHAESDGIELDSTVGAIIHQVSVRWCRNAIRLAVRNRNVIISDCHLYENSGVGVFLDDVNLHQINVATSHISYNRSGGIVVRDGNVRNLQVSGCDIEGNMPADETATRTANILIDVSGSPGDKSRSIAEISITGCTIQHAANYSGKSGATVAPGGANIRLAGKPIYPIDSVTITGNVMSDTTTNVDIAHATDIAINANTFFAPKPANLTVRHSRRVNVSGNTFNPRQFQRPGTIEFVDCHDGLLAQCTLHRFATNEGAVLLRECSGMVLSGLVLSDCDSGIRLRDCRDTTISACRVSRTKQGQADIVVDSSNHGIRLSGNAWSGEARIDSKAIDQGDR